MRTRNQFGRLEPKVSTGPRPKPPYDITRALSAHEAGKLTQHETHELFQYLVNTGLAWSLQGSYGRTAAALINAGCIQPRTGR